MKTIRIIFALVLGGALGFIAHAGDLQACSEHLPFGVPTLAAGLNITPICHAGYAALVDDDAEVPRVVSYHLHGGGARGEDAAKSDHTLGCFERKNNFHADDGLPATSRAKPSDYDKTGYDIGHQAPAADFAWSKAEMSDSFSLANMAPQLPGLNRQGWERLEDMVRTWAWTRGDLLMYVGPVLRAGDKRICGDPAKHPSCSAGIEVPDAFFKVVVDLSTHDVLAFEMPQQAITKAQALGFVTSVAQIERDAGITLPLPAGADKSAKGAPWPGDLSGWTAAAEKACGG